MVCWSENVNIGKKYTILVKGHLLYAECSGYARVASEELKRQDISAAPERLVGPCGVCVWGSCVNRSVRMFGNPLHCTIIPFLL